MESLCDTLPLCQISSDIVMGQGNLDAEIMFIGEAPGANEAIQRTPFVGRGGQLLNRTLQEFAGISRDDVYVSNIVKVRPPENRDPTPEEIAAFLPFLQEEIAFIQPKMFVTLGRFSMNFFLPDSKISQVHGVMQRFWWNGEITYLLPQYHPAAALRGTRVLNVFQEDIGKIPAALAWAKKQQENDKNLKEIQEALL
jgi:uracil-DNA glycosylase family 4